MIEMEEFLVITEELSGEIPQEFFEELNGGVRISEETKFNPHGRNNDLVILGEYHRSSMMGSQILLYYGSFCYLYGHLDREHLKICMRKTLRHEFRHHLEFRSGIRDLEIEDRNFLLEYLRRNHESR